MEGVGGGGEASELDKKRRGLEQSQQKQSGKWSWELAAFLSPFSLPFLEKINWKLSSFLFFSPFFLFCPTRPMKEKKKMQKSKKRKINKCPVFACFGFVVCSFSSHFRVFFRSYSASIFCQICVKFQSFLCHFRLIFGPFFSHFCVIFVSFLDHFWIIFGSFLDHFWIIFVSFFQIFLSHFSVISDLYLGHFSVIFRVVKLG